MRLMDFRHLSQTVPIVLWLCVVFCGTRGLAQDAQPAKPSVLNSTYTIKYPAGASSASPARSFSLTYHLHEGLGSLILDTEPQNGEPAVHSVEFAQVKCVEVRALLGNLDPKSKKDLVWIEDSGGTPLLIVPLRSEAEATELAEYVAKRAGLELIAGTWRFRRQFLCPQPTQLACQEFKELLDHDDREIADYFYQRAGTTHTFACFSDEERRFFIAQYYQLGEYGSFYQHVFENGQEGSLTIGHINWRGDSGAITDVFSKVKGPPLGWIDSASLSLEREFKNKMNTTTHYSLQIRWSTGRYTENYSGKDDKGKPFDNDRTGLCVKLN